MAGETGEVAPAVGSVLMQGSCTNQGHSVRYESNTSRIRFEGRRYRRQRSIHIEGRLKRLYQFSKSERLEIGPSTCAYYIRCRFHLTLELLTSQNVSVQTKDIETTGLT